ncbi:hypothetical protein L1077_13535 [Pseudoalteromonas luteoviolacea]|uniref:hypothetical protein n=1 Tax=Pseudoalteromonas luteoviolacea TaxID=43657 RepID=UPI001F23A90B|nr:hypothetical protein [Pseudoalteromonas luteoviolacea]MCF6440453.1 hypothetical protein [Pseudoalteromonas luteoviolacea]
MEEFEIQYKECFVAFLDVLGFQEMLNEHKKEKLEKYFKIVEKEIHNLKSADTIIKRYIKSIVISDSIILCVEPNNDQNKIQYLRELCIAIAKIQYELMSENIFLRGAITFGNVHFDVERHQIVGPAYVKAYKMEEDLAKFPRVILDTELVVLLEEDKRSFQELISRVNTSLSTEKLYRADVLYCQITPQITADQPLFVDYFSGLLRTNDCDKIERALNNIHRNLFKSSYQFPKYCWLRDYVLTLSNSNPNQCLSTQKSKIILKNLRGY